MPIKNFVLLNFLIQNFYTSKNYKSFPTKNTTNSYKYICTATDRHTGEQWRETSVKPTCMNQSNKGAVDTPSSSKYTFRVKISQPTSLLCQCASFIVSAPEKCVGARTTLLRFQNVQVLLVSELVSFYADAFGHLLVFLRSPK